VVDVDRVDNLRGRDKYVCGTTAPSLSYGHGLSRRGRRSGHTDDSEVLVQTVPDEGAAHVDE
jgi:hypothetical protein